MQTFMPYPSLIESVQVLDTKRLGKQRVEAKQILLILSGKTTGWKTHPAVRMWKGHEFPLTQYGIFACQEWKKRGYFDTLEKFFLDLQYSFRLGDFDKDLPPWFGNESFHASHRAALLAKNWKHYSQFGWKEQPCISYIWPV